MQRKKQAGPVAPDAAALTVEPGAPSPLGASPSPDPATPGVNFALWAPNATSVTLCVHDWEDTPVMETLMQRTGDVWHAFVAGLPQASAQGAGAAGPAGQAGALPTMLAPGQCCGQAGQCPQGPS